MRATAPLPLLLVLAATPLPAQVDAVVHSSPSPRVVAPAEGERRVLPDGREMLLKVGPANTGSGYLFLGAEDLPPGTSIPRHRHELDEEILIVQRGELTVELNDTAHVAPAGSVVFLPPRSWVAVSNRGSATATVMFVFPRGSVERCFQYIGRAPGEAPRPRTAQEQAEERRACQMTYRSHAH
ncbi:MAG TPA: cupin domain-containing protein [Longimicrobiaceae bacterium]|nr:cupin domain-containing protein [Longimicrobiaceae bacterium]